MFLKLSNIFFNNIFGTNSTHFAVVSVSFTDVYFYALCSYNQLNNLRWLFYYFKLKINAKKEARGREFQNCIHQQHSGASSLMTLHFFFFWEFLKSGYGIGKIQEDRTCPQWFLSPVQYKIYQKGVVFVLGRLVGVYCHQNICFCGKCCKLYFCYSVHIFSDKGCHCYIN